MDLAQFQLFKVPYHLLLNKEEVLLLASSFLVTYLIHLTHQDYLRDFDCYYYSIGIVNYGENYAAFESLIHHDALYVWYVPHFGDVIENHDEMALETQSFQVHSLFKKGSVDSFHHWTIVNVRLNDSLLIFKSIIPIDLFFRQHYSLECWNAYLID